MASYPGSIKSFTQQVDLTDQADAADVNEAYDEVEAIETELGTDPAGTAADVKTRLAQSLAGDGDIQFAASTELTIATGAITITQNWHRVEGQGAASDDLDTINGGTADRLLFLRASHTDHTITIKHNTGNILVVGNADITLDDSHDFAIFVYDGTLSKWICLGLEGRVVSAQVFLAAASGQPKVTAGCSAVTPIEMTTNDQNLRVLDFDKDTEEHADFTFALPSDYDGGTMTAKFFWLHAAAVTNFGVVWGIEGRVFGNDDALDQAVGTAQTVTDTGGTTSDLYISDATAAITWAGTPAGGKLINLTVYRKAADGSDNLAVDARLVGVQLTYTRT